MIQIPNEGILNAPLLGRGIALLCSALFFAADARAGDASFTNLLNQGEDAGHKGDLPKALKYYADAGLMAATNAADLCVVARYYCELMPEAGSTEARKNLSGLARDCATRAVQLEPKSATAHVSLAVTYGKSLWFTDTETKLKWSKAMKVECETALALDPNQDIAYYLLGRWNFGTANIGFWQRGLVRLVYGALPKASNEEAIRDFKKAIAIAPNRIIHHAGLAAVYETMGDKKLAIAEWEKCMALKPVDGEDAAEKHDVEKKLAATHR